MTHFIAVFLLFFVSITYATEITSQETRIPMSEAGTNGLEALLVYPDDSKPHPIALISHGSPRNATDRPSMKASNFQAIAQQFAKRGWAVAVVLRRGYGSSGGGWAESYGPCKNANYQQAAEASSQDLHAAIKYLATLPQFNADSILAVGVSAGGFASIALTADNPPHGLRAAIIFAAGRGSYADKKVCDPDRLVNSFAKFGKTSRTPMLWVYAENDHFFSPSLAKKFLNAFNDNGGHATLLIAPAYGENGHFLFSKAGIDLWTPIVDKYLAQQHLP